MLYSETKVKGGIVAHIDGIDYLIPESKGHTFKIKEENEMCKCKRSINFKPMGGFIVGESGVPFNEYPNYAFMHNPSGERSSDYSSLLSEAARKAQEEIKRSAAIHLNPFNIKTESEIMDDVKVTIHHHDGFDVVVEQVDDEVSAKVVKKPELKDGSFYKVKLALGETAVIVYNEATKRFRSFDGWALNVKEVICEMVEA